MGSSEKPNCMEFVFVREDSKSRQEKVKAFWKFLDSQNCLQPHKGTLEHESSSKTESTKPRESLEEAMKEKDIWRKGLKVFQQLGLDKAAFAADKKCRPCQIQKTISCENLADTVTQPYEELNADMKAFDKRQENRASNQCEASYARDKLNQCNSSIMQKTKNNI